MARNNFLDLLQNDIDSCQYCLRKNVCDNVNRLNMMPIKDRDCPTKWRKRDGKSKTD